MSKTWDNTDTAMEEIATNVAEYSACNGLYLNVAKTQSMGRKFLTKVSPICITSLSPVLVLIQIFNLFFFNCNDKYF